MIDAVAGLVDMLVRVVSIFWIISNAGNLQLLYSRMW